MDGRRYSGGLSTSQAASQINATRTMQIITRKAVFSGAGGTHDDWDEFDRVMAAERRTAVLVMPRRVYSNG